MHSSLAIPKFSRRDLLIKGSKLSLTSLVLLTGVNAKVMADESQSTFAQDIDVLNEILGTEHEGIAAYQICVDGGLLQKDTIKMALLFQNHHKKHRDILAERINDLGGTPAAAKTQNEYSNDLNIVSLKSQKDALHLIVKLELGAANAYIGMLPSTNDHELAKIAGRIAADEVIHWTALSTLLHQPPPTQALSFGA
jgi:ferritin-like protein